MNYTSPHVARSTIAEVNQRDDSHGFRLSEIKKEHLMRHKYVVNCQTRDGKSWAQLPTILSGEIGKGGKFREKWDQQKEEMAESWTWERKHLIFISLWAISDSQ